ncbi:MAG: PEGA domain-containing protein [Patescibacteria group bacterium]
MIKKRLFILLILLALTSIALIAFVSQKPVFSLSVEPKDSLILIDGKEVGKTQVKLRVVKGNHQIQAIKDGYHPYLQDVVINKNISQSIVLVPVQELVNPGKPVSLNIPAYSADLFWPVSSDTLIAVNQNNSFLIKIVKSVVSTLYAKPIYSYSFVNPLVALIEKGNLDKVAVLNIENGQSVNFNAKEISLVISVSLDPDVKTLFLLGKLDPAARTATLYSTPLDKFSPEPKGSFKADSVLSLPGNNILLTLTADAADLSKFSVFDITNDKYLYQGTGNGVLLSPYYENLAIYSTNAVGVVSLRSFVQKDFPFSFEKQKLFWKTQNILGILTNMLPGVKVSSINVESGIQTSAVEIPELSQVSVRSVLGYIENTLYLQDADGKIWPINLP